MTARVRTTVLVRRGIRKKSLGIRDQNGLYVVVSQPHFLQARDDRLENMGDTPVGRDAPEIVTEAPEQANGVVLRDDDMIAQPGLDKLHQVLHSCLVGKQKIQSEAIQPYECTTSGKRRLVFVVVPVTGMTHDHTVRMSVARFDDIDLIVPVARDLSMR